MGNYDYQDRAKDHSMLVCDVVDAKIRTGFNFSQQDIDFYMNALKEATISAGSNPDKVVKCLNAFARLYGLEQNERLAAKHLPTFAEGGVEVRPLADELQSMVMSMPRLMEYRTESERNARPNAEAVPSAPLASVFLGKTDFGAGVFDATG